MRMIFTSEDIVYLHHLRNVLEAKQIECIIKNDRLASISGEIPMGQCWPELWVTDSLKEKWAKELIAKAQTNRNKKEDWVCENCGETHSSQFTDCWNCQDIKGF